LRSSRRSEIGPTSRAVWTYVCFVPAFLGVRSICTLAYIYVNYENPNIALTGAEWRLVHRKIIQRWRIDDCTSCPDGMNISALGPKVCRARIVPFHAQWERDVSFHELWQSCAKGCSAARFLKICGLGLDYCRHRRLREVRARGRSGPGFLIHTDLLPPISLVRHR